jgi:hypothetical protein
MSIIDVAKLYYGPDAEYWLATLKRVEDGLSERGIGYHAYFSYITKKYMEKSKWPNMMTSSKIMDECKAHLDALIEDLVLEFSLENDSFQSRVRIDIEPRDILTGDYVALSPLFRYIMSQMLGFYDLLPAFEDRAILQLQENPSYFKALGEDMQSFFPITKEAVPGYE